MKTIELFAGTESFASVMTDHGHETFTIELDDQFKPDLLADVRTLTADDFPYQPDILWASPPCQGFSVAVIGRNWNHNRTPKTDSARLSMELVKNTMRLIYESKPKFWFIENPRGMLRKMEWFDEWVKRQGGGPTYSHLLPVRGQKNEAHRHLDECSVVDPKSPLQKWRQVKFFPCFDDCLVTLLHEFQYLQIPFVL